jgi:hypothetical protein
VLASPDSTIYNVSYSRFTSNTTISDNYTAGFIQLNDTPFIPGLHHPEPLHCHRLQHPGGGHSNSDQYVAGCYSYCQGLNSTSGGAPCTGKGCCETAISPNLTDLGGIFCRSARAVCGASTHASIYAMRCSSRLGGTASGSRTF